MAIINRLPEYRLMQALTNKGLLGAIDLGDGTELPALTQQLIQFRSNDLAADERAIAILVNGQNEQGNSSLVDDKNYTMVIAGTADPADILFTRLIAEQFQDILNCEMNWGYSIAGLTNNGIAGPFYENDGRPCYEISGRLLMNKIVDEVAPEPEPEFGFGIWGLLGIYG